MALSSDKPSLAKWWLLRVGIPLIILAVGLSGALRLQDDTLVRESVRWQGQMIDFRIYERHRGIYFCVSERRSGGWSQVSLLADAESVDSSGAEILIDRQKGEVVLRCDTAEVVFDLSSRSVR